ncbi:hypothetical protein VaNZ11_004835 [Volvox africanus]|uniref:Endonuclease/exonuclease/phosphatase domain-containing protein n=1 Tax=Volvox africanus TaxID=51714 RepID=A0ABQ5RXI9_9CHLO|nr:hypothetical protein VaNZ11_004835 [Volvox africanus]
MTDHIDLTEDGNDNPSYVNKEEGSKKRIVALAEGLHDRLRVADSPARKRVRRAVDDVAVPAVAANGEMLQGRSISVFTATKPVAVPPPAPAPPQDATPQGSMNKMLAQLHAERLARMTEDGKAALKGPCTAETVKPGSSTQLNQQPSTVVAAASTSRHRTSGNQTVASVPTRSATVLSYNLWFNEDVALLERMRAVGDFIEREGHPDLLLFQEVTQNMVLIFRQQNWFRRYHCSPVPRERTYFTLLLARRDTVTLPAMQPWMEKEYNNTCMARSILYTRASVGGRLLVVGTTHLESPVGPGPQQMATQRQEQLVVAVRELEAAAGAWGDVLLAGDLNWSDTRDGPVRIPPRWCDAWLSLMPHHPGNTWDPVSNPMLTSHFKGSRLDRVLCRLSASGAPVAGPNNFSGGQGGGSCGGWQLGSIKLVGTQALPGLTYEHRGKRLPVLPSDHFGLLVKLIPAEAVQTTAGVGGLLETAPAHGQAPAAVAVVRSVKAATEASGSSQARATTAPASFPAATAVGQEAAAGSKPGIDVLKRRRLPPRSGTMADASAVGPPAAAAAAVAASAAPSRPSAAATTTAAAGAANTAAATTVWSAMGATSRSAMGATSRRATITTAASAEAHRPHQRQRRQPTVDLSLDDNIDSDGADGVVVL